MVRTAIRPGAGMAGLLVCAAALVPGAPARAAGFADVTTSELSDIIDGYGAAWVDYDNDGDLDICITSATSTRVLENDGAGHFGDGTPSTFTGYPNGRGFAWGDYDNDGLVDGYQAVEDAANQLFAGEGGETFSIVDDEALNHTGVSTDPRWADYDGDGDLDLYIPVYSATSRDLLVRNDGGDAFYDVPRDSWKNESFAQGVSWGDYDGDGDPDVYVCNSPGANRLYRNEGGGSFVDVATGNMAGGDPSSGAAWGDYDNDGDIDLYVVNYAAENRLFRNEGGGEFVEATPEAMKDPSTGAGCAWGDYDNDGDLDLYLANDLDRNALFVNDGAGGMTESTPSGLDDSGGGMGCAWGDYDGDGDLDLILANDGAISSCRLFRNELDPGPQWMQLELTGTASARSAVGARVRAVGRAGTEQIRTVGGDAGHMSQNARTVAFGFGITGTIDSVDVTWPSGIVQKVLAFEANAVNHVTEAPPPDWPSGCEATSSSCASVEITWADNSDDEIGFHVYREGELLETLAADETYYEDAAAVPGVEYTYSVYAFNNSGSSAACATTGERRAAPPAPETLAASDTSCAGVFLEWGYVPEAEGYRLFRDGAEIGSAAPSIQFLFDEVSPGDHLYGVVAENACGVSDTLTATGTVLDATAAPGAFTASDTSCTGVALAWAGVPDADGYRLFRAGVEIADVEAGVLSWYDEPGPGSHHYAAIAENGCGQSDSALAEGAVLAEPEPPAALAASDTSCAGVLLAWEAAAGASRYVIHRDGQEIETVEASTPAYFDAVGPGSYRYAVIAENDCARSDSAAADGSVPAPPDPPGGVTASDSSCSVVRLDWEASARADSYVVTRDDSAIARLPAEVLFLANDAPEGSYTFGVTALGACGAGETAFAVGTVLTGAPDAPAELSASDEQCDSVVVTWTDRSDDELGFEVSRDGAPHDTVDADVTRWVDYLPAGDHLYGVRAIGLCGRSPAAEGEGGPLPAVGAPVLDGPEAGLVALTPPVRLCWFAEEGAESYTVQIAVDSLFQKPFGENASSVTGDTFHVIEEVTREQTLYWRVAADGNFGGGEISETASVVVAPQRPLGDTDADYDVDLADIDRGVDYILGASEAGAADSAASDLNGDGRIDVGDIVALVAAVGEQALSRAARGELYGAQPLAAGGWTAEIVPPAADAPTGACYRVFLTVDRAEPLRSVIVFLEYDSDLLRIGGGDFQESRNGERSALTWYGRRIGATDRFIATIELCPAGDADALARDGTRIAVGPVLVSEGGNEPLLLASDPERFDIGLPPAAEVALGRSYPNPFNPAVVIPFTLPAPAAARLVVHDASGRRVRTLLDRFLPAGPNKAVWDGRGDNGRPAGSGTYFYTLFASGERRVGRMVLLR